jgi:hypothetical protein
MANISSPQRHSRHLAAEGQLDFSHLLTEPKDSSTITTFDSNQWFDCTERNQGWIDGWIVGHLRYLKFNVVLLSDMKIVLKSSDIKNI